MKFEYKMLQRVQCLQFEGDVVVDVFVQQSGASFDLFGIRDGRTGCTDWKKLNFIAAIEIQIHGSVWDWLLLKGLGGSLKEIQPA